MHAHTPLNSCLCEDTDEHAGAQKCKNLKGTSVCYISDMSRLLYKNTTRTNFLHLQSRPETYIWFGMFLICELVKVFFPGSFPVCDTHTTCGAL